MLILLLFVVYLFDYLKKRGENRAIKEDLSEMTHATESIKSTYGKEIETLRAALATKSHFNRVRYERETEVYRELWTALVELGDVTQFLRPGLEMVDRNETEDQRKARKATAFVEKQRRLYDITTKNRPFYPSEVWQKLSAFLKLTDDEFIQYQFTDPMGGDPATVIKEARENYQKALSNQVEIREKISGICEAIRHRLDKFDGPDSLA